MERLCPVHATPMESRGKLWHCETCAANYRVRGECADCGSELEKIAACGASNWWCNRCNELKSKSKVKTELVAA
ncbi:zinc ribbon domain-containing protein [Niveibacterium umoris]|uniref:Formamidopyrimidine-DNA glycosylase n=1 Tax=Niveibacterium umoris TaxID=1193620 RepID=A0A840BKH5_9RHOO|nr:zinc ribbon domain-containing protein [Niveibacterium umoris]MBB4014061.1 formamidopyrimidine-DNA glycosylase [Niveibacterium umoris]